MGETRSGVYGLTDESRQAVCYVGRAFDINLRYRQHMSDGRKYLGWARYRGWLDQPIMCGRVNWLAYMLLTGRKVGLVLLEDVECDQSKQHEREIAWARRLRRDGVPLANGDAWSAKLGIYLDKGDCPYTSALPTVEVDSIPPPEGCLRIPSKWSNVIAISDILQQI